MTLDDFQTRLRAIYDATVAAVVEARRVQEQALDVLFAEAEADGSLSAEDAGAVLNVEVIRTAEAIRAAGVGA